MILWRLKVRFNRLYILMPSCFVHPILITFTFRALFAFRSYLFIKHNHFL
ncbi:hypothetical protein A676_01911 [Salmonella enterica subsp. enterica serovar Enteritidis str. 2010K-0262]|nr:hypothetical protein A672_00852 [Salmonella enterica subsp. enterica serovar Enteritidis str. 08-1080]EPI78688.1 hypothetical protein A675_04871 [Salmonella enterica subsp. enterica serovar Enteritidis str. 2009K1726]EPI83788.1 hypothetical protein A676_01911 [Salmonella enterica subsp. enterica serovar Enteritidis str. 2010K-0262]EPI89646.1 hypothetical protein A674_00834 [Salmonella enterica subsp. enterica serovar Enteritidis str. 2009K1651]EPJ03768.1 hypothetical protein A677_00629 [Salm